MVLSCSLRDFLSPLGMEIRLGLCKRIFYFSFFPPLLFFFMFVVQNDLFGNLIWIFFFSLTTAFFSFAVCCNRTQTFVPWILAVENSGKALFFRLEGGENLGFQLRLSFGHSQQKFNLKTYRWTLTAFSDIKMDNYQLEVWWILWRSSCDLSSVSWLDYCMNLHFSTQQSLVISQELIIASRLTLCDWSAGLTWLLIKVAGKAITTSDILGMLCLLSSVFHNIQLQSSHRQEWSLHQHKLDCVAYTFHHPQGLYSWQLLINQ